MIEWLLIENFQNHKKRKVVFDKHCTTFVGDTNEGKSACLRALRWLGLNLPRGDKFVGDWGKAPFAKVTARIDGHVIARVRGKVGNYYKLDGEKLKAPGKGVPEPIRKILNLCDENFQRQIDPPFWFTERPSTVSKKLNAIVNLGAIDQALKNAGDLVRLNKTRYGLSQERYKKAKEELKQLNWVEEFDQDIKKLESLESKRAQLDKELKALDLCAKSHLALSRRVERLRRACSAGAQVIAAGAKATTLARQVRSLDRAAHQMQKLEDTIDFGAPDTSKLEALVNKYQTLATEVRALDSVALGMQNLEYEIEHTDMEVGASHSQIKKLTKGRCPLCHQKIKFSPSPLA